MNVSTLLLLGVGGYLAYTYFLAPAAGAPAGGGQVGAAQPLSIPIILQHAPPGLTVDQLAQWIAATPAWRMLYVGTQTGISEEMIYQGAYHVAAHAQDEYGVAYQYA